MPNKKRPPILRCLRPHQWVKNIVVLAACIFALGDANQHINGQTLALALLGAALFSLLSSSIYIINDIRDITLDRNHPTKRFRPIASGEVPLPAAKQLSAALTLSVLLIATLLSPPFAAILLLYYLMQLAYTIKLKTIALIDVTIIALGFVLRALSGAILINVTISPWLLTCTLLLAMMLGLSKRRHEKIILAALQNTSRPSLQHYSERLLDILIWTISLSTLIAYTAYTLAPSTLQKFGTNNLIYSAPFVLAGLLRYLTLVYKQEQGDRPEKILLTDPPLILILIGYGITILSIFLNA